MSAKRKNDKSRRPEDRRVGPSLTLDEREMFERAKRRLRTLMTLGAAGTDRLKDGHVNEDVRKALFDVFEDALDQLDEVDLLFKSADTRAAR